MKKIASRLFVALALGAPIAALAAAPMPPTKVSMEKCMMAVLQVYPGQVTELEFVTDNGAPVYEFEIETTAGRDVEVECSADSGKIIEAEYEDEDIPLNAFFEKAKISDHDAFRIAVKEVPGEVVEIERELSMETGQVYYEVEILSKGTLHEVEIDAVTGKIVEVEKQFYKIGD